MMNIGCLRAIKESNQMLISQVSSREEEEEVEEEKGGS